MPKKDHNENEAAATPESAPQAQGAIETILVVNVLLALLEQLIPKLANLGDANITAEQQEAIRARYDALTADMDAAFGGDHWRVRPN